MKPWLTFAWTPGDSFMGVGSIALPEKPANGLDWTTYKHALADRIDRMINELSDDEARALLRIVEEYDRLTLPPPPPVPEEEEGCARPVTFSGFGLAMVENSGWLQARMGWPGGVVPPDRLHHDPDTLAVLLEDDILEEYLGRVYYSGSD